VGDLTVTYTRWDLENQVEDALGDSVGDFDMDGIVDDIVAEYGRVHIDDVPINVFWAIAERHLYS
jgi:hypothetical protein